MDIKNLSWIFALIVSGLISVLWINQEYRLHRDIESNAHRAQVAADVSDMLGYIKEMKAGMERNRMTHGHTALIFKTPANDLAKLSGTINQIIARLEAVKGIPRSEMTYQVALDDIRGTIRELESPSSGYIWCEYWILILIGIGIWILPVFVYREYIF